MVAATGGQGIRYPELADAPCDWDLHMRWMAEDIDAKLTAHDVDLDRTLPEIPAMMLRLSVPTDLANPLLGTLVEVGTPVPFDSIEHQSGGVFARLSVDPTLFRMPRTGYYHVGLNYSLAAGHDGDDPDFVVGPVRNQYAFNLIKYPSTPEVALRTQQFDRTGGDDPFQQGERGTLSGVVRVTSTSDYYWWSTSLVGFVGTVDSTYKILEARAYAFWTADL